jgi:Tol biopolymer transport system component
VAGVIYAEYRSVVTGEADIYLVDDPGAGPEQKTNGFLKVSGPSMRADGQQIAFAARATGADSQMIWLLPGAGGGPTDGFAIGQPTPLGVPNTHKFMANARYTHEGTWLLYNSDSAEVGVGGVARPWFRDTGTNAGPERVFENLSLVSRTFWMPNWGPDINSDGLPDSVVTTGIRFFGSQSPDISGFYKIPTRPPQNATPEVWLEDFDASEPDWSPDGQYMVFADANTTTGERDIWIIRADTNDRNNAVRITSGPADDSHPRFSADGNTIVFVSNRADHYGLNGIYTTDGRGYNIWSVTRFDRP